MHSATRTPTKVLLFDGVCNLCNSSVNFILDNEREAEISFASLQSDEGTALLSRYDLPTNYIDSLVFIDGSNIYTSSSAALEVAKSLRWPLNILSIFKWIPKPLRDAAYGWIARNRYKWFGKQDACRMPSPEWKNRFLDS